MSTIAIVLVGLSLSSGLGLLVYGAYLIGWWQGWCDRNAKGRVSSDSPRPLDSGNLKGGSL